MPPPSRTHLIRAANRIAAQRQPPPAAIDDLPLASWQRVQRSYSLVVAAQLRKWRYAARQGRDRLRRSLADLRRQLDELNGQLAASGPGYSPSFRDLHDDLAVLAAEFPDFSLDLAQATISVVTEPIILEGVDLGRFEIELSWRELGSRSNYLVRALEERSAASDSSLVHPHVRDEQLCEGEAHAAIRRALSSGRILDFFVIVAQTLATYNAQSAYLTLDRWEGISCADCGATTDDDGRSSCERCGADLCDDCSYGCSDCGRTACSACGASCAECRQHCCGACLSPCSICQQRFCEGDLDEGECAACRAEAAAEDSHQPLCLGQTSLPA
ncbi:MAG: hypothetical protein JNL18_23005 [Planctomycetaceae bacterium]|nr:hypothetical protein [Planctomycetaceae bacterium]